MARLAFETRRREGQRSTMDEAALAQILESAQESGVELGPIAPSPRRWVRGLRADTAPVGELPAQPWALVRALIRRRPGGFVITLIAGMVGTVSSTLIPWAMGRTIDAGIAAGFGADFAQAALVFLGLVLLVAAGDALNQLGEIAVWMTGSIGGRKVISRHVSQQSRAIKAQHTSGDVVTASSDDSATIGELFSDLAELVSALASIIVASYIMLSTSLSLGLTVLIGVPIVMTLLALIGKPIEKRQESVRQAQGELATIAADAVQGLRILRGIGGEDTYAESYEKQSEELRMRASRAAMAVALLYAARVAAPLLLITIVITQGVFLVLAGALTTGQLLAFYGFALYLRHSLWIWARLIQHLAGAKVGARRLASIVATQPLVTDDEVSSPPHRIDWDRATLSVTVDGTTYTLEPGKITAILSADSEKGARIARAFARTSDPSPLTVNGIPAGQISVDELRTNLVLSEATAQLFAGTLRDALLGEAADLPTPRGVTQAVWEYQIDVFSPEEEGAIHPSEHPHDGELTQALAWAHAGDAVDSLKGLDGHLAEKGRNISGGQRQRLALARAYATHAPVLILVEPTSALDSHTEALIGADLPVARAGQTTLLITHSPLVSAYADIVITVDDALEGTQNATGAQSHAEGRLA